MRLIDKTETSVLSPLAISQKREFSAKADIVMHKLNISFDDTVVVLLEDRRAKNNKEAVFNWLLGETNRRLAEHESVSISSLAEALRLELEKKVHEQ